MFLLNMSIVATSPEALEALEETLDETGALEATCPETMRTQVYDSVFEADLWPVIMLSRARLGACCSDRNC